ncbi:MAG TPA: HIT family protein [Vicinamibacterales bacterium]
MARINPDPYAGVHLFALVHRVTGLLDGQGQVLAAVRALEESGVATDDIDLFVGEEGARALDLQGREHGRVVRVLRTLEAAVGDEAAANQRIDEALRRGATLVSIRVHNEPPVRGRLNQSGQDAAASSEGLAEALRRYWRGDWRNAEKERAVRVLRSHHAHEIHYWGTWGFEDVATNVPPCDFCALPPDRILGENRHAVWVLDSNPVSPGHSLILPKRHVESFFETTPAERDAMLSLLDQAREHVGQKHSPAGYNIGINDGLAAGQTESHIHVHLIPRYPGDSEQPRGGVRWVIPATADYWSRQNVTGGVQPPAG